MRTPTQPLIISYRDLSHCKKPEYLPEYKANCWGQCKAGQSCSKPPTADDISENRLAINIYFHDAKQGLRFFSTDQKKKNCIVVLCIVGIVSWIVPGGRAILWKLQLGKPKKWNCGD